MQDPGSLAARLADAGEVSSAAEHLAAYLRALVPHAAVRVYVRGPGDRCTTCPRARGCRARQSCLHLEASLGDFRRPAGHVDRIPRDSTPWGDLQTESRALDAKEPPPELEAPEQHEGPGSALLVPMQAGGEEVGAVGLRTDAPLDETARAAVCTAAFLAAATLRLLSSLRTEKERRRQLLLVNEVGRKVNSILNDDLLLEQAAVDIQRTFGFHNVMIFMRTPEEERLELRAQTAVAAVKAPTVTDVGTSEGIIGRVYRTGQTEVVQDVRNDPDFVAWFPDTMAEIAVPIQVGGVVEGVLNVESDHIGSFGTSERIVLETVANQLAIAIENARLFGMVKEREDRYRILVESNPGAVLHLDHSGRVIFVNPAAAEMTGRTRDELLARAPLLADLAVPDDRGSLGESVAEALAGRPQPEVPFQLAHTEGGTRWVQASLQPLATERGEARGVVVLALDRTNERELQDRLYQSEKLSAIGSLVSGVAHELNNPLAGILGFAQLLLSRPHEEWTHGDMEKIEKNAHRCQAIVENLLAFARQARLSKRPANVNEVIESVLRLNEYQFHMNDIQVQRDLDLRVPRVEMDVNRWQQVFVNLAANAMQALVEEECESRSIRFETRLREGAIEIRVSDSGPGIPEEMRARVFEPFFTTKSAGTGLGLGICYGIVKDHGGTIELDPAAPRGTCFRITIPVVEGGAPAEPVEATVAPARSEAGHGRRVLIVDDEEHVRDVVAGALRNHQYEVDAAPDGASALDCIATRSYDVILTDVSMPGDLKGIALYDTIEERHADVAARVVFLTGHVNDEDLRAEMDARGAPCIEKPFDIRELARVVNEVAARRTASSDT